MRSLKPFWEQHRNILGKLHDREVAERLGLSERKVRAGRESLGIKRSWVIINRKRGLDWTDPEIQGLLGTMPDAKLARMLGVSHDCIRGRRESFGVNQMRAKVKWDDVSDLGKVRDSTIARRLGVTITAVGQARKARGIPFNKEVRHCFCRTAFAVTNGKETKTEFCSGQCRASYKFTQSGVAKFFGTTEAWLLMSDEFRHLFALLTLFRRTIQGRHPRSTYVNSRIEISTAA